MIGLHEESTMTWNSWKWPGYEEAECISVFSFRGTAVTIHNFQELIRLITNLSSMISD